MKKSNSTAVLAALFFVFLLLLSIVDMRRGFLFSEHWYLFKTPFLIFSPAQVFLFVGGALGIKMISKTLETLSGKENKKLLFGLFVLLILDFVLYRGIAMERTLQKGKIGLDWLDAFGEAGILKPIYLSISYLFTVWHAIFLSCLLGSWGFLALPYFAPALNKSSSLKSGIAGTLYSFTQPLCACCVAITSASTTSLPRSFAISSMVGAPMLNISTLILAGSLLPWPFAIIRIVGGLLLTLTLGVVIGRYVTEYSKDLTCEISFEPPFQKSLLINWLKTSGRLALWLLPSIVIGILLTSFIWQFWPKSFTNSLASVALVSTLGSLLMISTWSEIPLVLQMLGHGLNGPAAAALIALPAINLSSLLLIGKSTGQWRLVLMLGISIALVSFLVGACFV